MIENSASIFFYQVCPVCEENLGKDAIMQFSHSNSRKVHMLYLSLTFCVLKYNLAHAWFYECNTPDRYYRLIYTK